MKEVFFRGLVIALPICVISGLLYGVFIGFYSLFTDMRLKRELDQIAREADERRKRQSSSELGEKQPSVEDLFKS